MTTSQSLSVETPARPDATNRPAARPARTPTETLLAGSLLLVLGGAVVAGRGIGLVLQGLGCLVAVLWLAQDPKGLSRAFARLDPVVLALLALLVLSIAWSADPTLSARRAAGAVAASAFGLYLADRYSLTDQMLLVLRALTVAAVLSAVVAVVAPRYGVATGGWRGVFLTKNVLARLMALGVLASLLAMASLKGQPVRRRGAGACGLVCAAVLLQAGSAFATLVLGLVVALVAVAVLIARTQYPFRQASVVAAVTATAAVVAWAWLRRDTLLGSLDRGSDLTGRRPLWDSVLPVIEERFWFGHGYGAFWRGWEEPSNLVWLQNPWGPPHAHNGALELALNVGAVGVALWLVALLACARRGLLQVRDSRAAYWPVGLVLLTLAFNVTEVTLMNNALFWALFVAASANVYAAGRHSPSGPYAAAQKPPK